MKFVEYKYRQTDIYFFMSPGILKAFSDVVEGAYDKIR